MPKKRHRHVAECLRCGHTDNVYKSKEEYKEVEFCPNCKGAFVDRWYKERYITQVNASVVRN